MTLADIEADVLEAERRLRLLTGVAERSFAYPCYQDFVGCGPTRQSYVPVIARHLVAARGSGEYPRQPSPYLRLALPLVTQSGVSQRRRTNRLGGVVHAARAMDYPDLSRH